MINYNNTSKLLIPQVQENTTINLKPKSSQGASDTVFKSVFDKSLIDTTKSTYASNASKADNDISKDTAPIVKYKSFRDANMAQRVSSRENLGESPSLAVTSQNVDLEIKELANVPQEYDEQISVLAQMLGIQPSELIKLANDLGFSAEDLKDTKDLSLFMDKLSNVLDLNDSQKTMLNTLVAEVSKQVKTQAGSDLVETLESPKADEALNETKSTDNTKAIDLSKVADDVKAKLDKLIQNVTVDSESVSSEISKVIEAMKSQIKAKVPVSAEQAEAKSTADVSTTDDIPNAEQLSVEGNVTKEKEAAKTSNSKEEANSQNADSSNTKTEVEIKSVNTQVSTSNDQNQQNVQTIGDVKVGMAGGQAEVQKLVSSMPQPIKNSEVLNQVVEQAKVIIGQDKSEMIIQLKPDHLGKLELKVVTEQGIVAAKFIAESQQVKEIIETNMQLLKDSLQKQGISIDSVSVQVGPDKQSDYQQQNSYQSKNNSSNNRHKYGSSESGIQKVGYNTFDALPEKLAQYAYDSNTINLTA
ncbi:MAG: flagellar hook-length control protein FliK [Ruminiclostridium sp.]